ncbi:unnamed protein product [Prunus armeniaca]
MDDNDLGDIGSDPYELANVIGDGDQPLYPGCRNTLPSSMYEAKKTFSSLGMSYKKIQYPNDCILYRNDYEDSINCPICGISRWKEAKSLTWHADRKSVDGNMSHLVDSPSWKLVDDKWPEFGYKSYPICGDNIPSHRLKNGHKICYIRHRKWLPINHPYHRQHAAFNWKLEYDTPPEPLTREEVLQMVEGINYKWGSKNEGSVGVNDGDIVCWKKNSKFFDLEYWKYLPVRLVLDVMHIEKNVCDSIIGTLLEISGKK